MKSGQVAEAAGVHVETLRYYERRGLLREPRRLPSGYRAYGADAVHVVRFVRRAQELGFTLAEVETLLQLADGGPERCEAAQALANERLAELERKIASLRAMRDSLRRLVATCALPRGERECPLIQSISESAPRRIDHP
jgi:Hg(II)-responsive transcriptional regulator